MTRITTAKLKKIIRKQNTTTVKLPEDIKEIADAAWFLQQCAECSCPLPDELIKQVKPERITGMPVICSKCLADFQQEDSHV